ncbi:MAG: hypothetical protein ACFBSC_19180 [Microcoleaceae cyanobacterium]
MTSPTKDSASVSTGLMIAIVFTIGFFLVDHDLGFSILMGLIAGTSAYFLTLWWYIDELLPSERSSRWSAIRDRLVTVPDEHRKRHPSRYRKTTRPVTMFEWAMRRNQAGSQEDE